MSLRPLKTIDRRGDWRARLPFWDRETFQTIPVGAIGDANEAVVSLALFREGDDGCLCGRWGRDYGFLRLWHQQPILNVFTNDWTTFLALEDGGLAAILKVPQIVMAHVPPGSYRASLAAAFQNGDVIDLGADLVSVVGQATPTVFAGPQMIGGQQPFANGEPFSGFYPPPIPILPGGFTRPDPVLPPSAAPFTAAWIAGLPTAAPTLGGVLWNNGGFLAVSGGANGSGTYVSPDDLQSNALALGALPYPLTTSTPIVPGVLWDNGGLVAIS